MNNTVTLQEALPGYQRYLHSLCYSRRTIAHYTQEAKTFAEFASRRGTIRPAAVRVTDLEAWQKTLGDSGRSTLATIVKYRVENRHGFSAARIPKAAIRFP